MGEVGSSDDRMLVSVDARSRPEAQLEVNKEFPKGVEVVTKFDRCGIEPALSLDSKAALLELFGGPLFGASADAEEGLKGLVDGVGRDVLERSDCWMLTPLIVPTGENLDGTVPARVRRDGLVRFVSEGGTRSGNPSWDGDSGIVSRNGVEFPLVGGPQMLGDKPSPRVCSSRVRFGNSLVAWSCKGEPAPNRIPPTAELEGPMIFAPEKADFMEAPAVGSTGDVLEVDDSDGGRLLLGGGR